MYFVLPYHSFSQGSDQAINRMFFDKVINRASRENKESVRDIFVVGNFVNTLFGTNSLSQYLKRYENISLPNATPQQLLIEYNSILEELDVWKNDVMVQSELNLQNDIQNIIDLTQKQLLALGVNITTKDPNADAVIKQIIYETAGKEIIKEILRKKEAKINEKRRIYQAKLDEDLQTRMESHKDDIIAKNILASEQYLFAAAYSLSLQEQNQYLNHYAFHQCCIDFIKSNYNYKTTDWLNVVCPFSEARDTSTDEISYFDLAKIKYSLYEKYNDPTFLKAANDILALDQDNNISNPRYYLYMSKIGLTVLDKLYYLLVAQKLDPQINEYSDLLNEYKDKVRLQLQSAIDIDNLNFIKDFSAKFSFKGHQVNNSPIITYVIQNDKPDVLDLIIQKYQMDNIDLEEFEGELVGKAILYNSKNCLVRLKTLGFPLNVLYNESFDVYYLAHIKKNNEILNMLVKWQVDYSATLKYLKDNNRLNELTELSLKIYTSNPNFEIRKDLTNYVEDFTDHIPNEKNILISSSPKNLKFRLSNGEEGITPSIVSLQFDNYSMEFNNKGVSFKSDFTVLINSEDEILFDCKIPEEHTEIIGPYSLPFVFVEMDNNNSFYISKYELSQQVYGYLIKKNTKNKSNNNFPAGSINAGDAVEFCHKLNERLDYHSNEHLFSYSNQDNKYNYKEIGFRLPTKDEWIYACKGGAKSKGNEIIQAAVFKQIAWYSKNSKKIKNPVGKKAPNELGIYDMIGNISEWCTDGTDTDSTSFVLMGYNYLSSLNKLKEPFNENEINEETIKCSGIRLVKIPVFSTTIIQN